MALKNLPHTFTVSAPEGARFPLITEPAGFESFMCSGVERLGLLHCRRLLAVPPTQNGCALEVENGIDILGLPRIST